MKKGGKHHQMSEIQLVRACFYSLGAPGNDLESFGGIREQKGGILQAFGRHSSARFQPVSSLRLALDSSAWPVSLNLWHSGSRFCPVSLNLWHSGAQCRPCGPTWSISLQFQLHCVHAGCRYRAMHRRRTHGMQVWVRWEMWCILSWWHCMEILVWRWRHRRRMPWHCR